MTRTHRPRRDTAAARLAREIAQDLAPRGVTRRSMLRGAGLGAMALGGAWTLSACGTEGQQQTADSCPPPDDLSDTEKVLVFSNWPEYIDVAGKKRPTLDRFQAQSGIEVTYNTDINDNNEFFAKVKDQLGACEPIGRDIITMTDWMAGRMVSLGWMQELDKSAMPNVEANLIESLRSPSWDPDRTYSVPWQSGLTGIAYNAKYTGEVSGFEELLTRADLKGKVTLLKEMDDTMGFMIALDGGDPADFTDEEFDSAVARLEEYVQNGQIRSFTGNDYVQDLQAGNVVACEAWSGDVMIMQSENPDIRFVAPEEGLSIWSDNMMVPAQSPHLANAQRLMDYYYEPEVAAELAAWVWYISPVKGAEDAVAQFDESLVGQDLVFPSEEFLANTWNFRELDEQTRTKYEKAYALASGA
jgi:spermidine/putrescine transport system substrate-binding protein